MSARDFVSKPFDLVEVRTRIHNMLEVRLLYGKRDRPFSVRYRTDPAAASLHPAPWCPLLLPGQDTSSTGPGTATPSRALFLYQGSRRSVSRFTTE